MRGCATFSTAQPKVATVGIDFGCKNSRVAITDSLVVGELAKRRRLRMPSDVVFNIKSLVGMQFDDSYVQEMRKRVQFSIIEGPRGEAWLKVVISIPSFFSDQQREGIKSAGERAGLEVLEIIDEPKAAALSTTTIKDGNVVVFGMGSRSYSISILHVSETNIKIKAQVGDCSVGGDLFDDILVDYIVTHVMELYSVDIRGDKHAMTTLAEAVEEAKVELSSQLEATVSIPYLTSSAQGPIDLHFSISRSQFEKLVRNLVEIVEDKCQRILKESNLSQKDIDEVVLMGGMTRVPKIRSIIEKIFGKHHSRRVNPEEAAVIGSAIQAALIVEDQREISEETIPLSIGIQSD
ncbi:Heat shock 70 kDa protein, mitochondrial [Dichanthelium oligosanthes]|uniref:Heat shock 70 kDa protein, mitochondrial n=1 Tax=Dichanthelium oligosanthes TaxID=888268 RepID=A0A1E5VHB4_9POAL|nr:Heat shock 70 kDa protein, mitochondrial [Dichanthelium oligosanthes]